jgi:hypothetical protein
MRRSDVSAWVRDEMTMRPFFLMVLRQGREAAMQRGS